MPHKANKLSVPELARQGALAICVLLGGLSAPAAGVTRYEIVHAGVFGYSGVANQSVYWIDNDRVLFIGARAGDWELLSDGRKKLRSYLMEWNVRSGAVKDLVKMGEFNGLCYYRGYVRYNFTVDRQITIREGELGKEFEVELKPRDEVDTNRITCRSYDRREIAHRVGAGFWPLRDEDGYWGGRSGFDPQKYTFLVRFDAGQKTERRIEIPYQPPPAWSEYAKAYIFRRLESLLSSTKTSGRLWLLKTGGQVERIEIPAGPWFGGGTGYGIAKPGVFLWSHALGGNDNGAAGGYLVVDNKIARFIDGFIYASSISPDGCQVAMSIRRARTARASPDMLMVKLCESGGR